MKAPLERFSKKQILKLHHGRCKHGHSYIAHWNCCVKERNEKERIGFLDIEASNLKADYGIMFSYCIKVLGKNQIYSRVVTGEELKRCRDKKVVEQCIKDMLTFDLIVTWYGAKFDIPFIRTRALSLGVEFPKHKALNHQDAWRISKDKLKLSSNRLKSVAKLVLGKSKKTELEPNSWLGALQGDRQSLSYILHHNKMDVIDLEKIWLALHEFSAAPKGSI